MEETTETLFLSNFISGYLSNLKSIWLESVSLFISHCEELFLARFNQMPIGCRSSNVEAGGTTFVTFSESS